MLTDNFKIWQEFVLTNTSFGDEVIPLPASMTSTTTNGSTTSGWTHIQCNEDSFAQSYSGVHKSLIFYGTGTTPASVTDVCLEDPLSTVLEVSSSTSVSGEFTNHTGIISIDSVAKNVGSVNATITELIWIKELKLSNTAGATTASTKYVAMAREVLDRPVTIAPGKTHNFSIKLMF